MGSMIDDRSYFSRRVSEENEAAKAAKLKAAKQRHQQLALLFAERAKTYEWPTHRR